MLFPFSRRWLPIGQAILFLSCSGFQGGLAEDAPGVTFEFASEAERFEKAPGLPARGAHELRIVGDGIVELYLVSQRESASERPSHWDWVDEESACRGCFHAMFVDLHDSRAAAEEGKRHGPHRCLSSLRPR